MSRPRLSPEALARLRERYPRFDSDHQLAEAVVRDCAIAYLWNPYVDADAFSYAGWSTTLYAGVDAASRTAYVVFRGTDSLLDWVVNVSCVPLRFFHPRAHGGFVASWKLARRRLLPWLRAHAHRFDRVVVSGHSLGGALAMACAYDLHRDGFAIERCVTIGAPRVYTARSAATVEGAIGSRVMRICRTQDIVPRVPPSWLGYRHVGQEWEYVSELFGDREPAPLPEVERWLGLGLRILTLGPVGDWLERNGGNTDQATTLFILLTAAVGTLSFTLGAFIQWSALLLLAAGLLFVITTALFVGGIAHRSGRYAATRDTRTLAEEWQAYHLQELAAGQAPGEAGSHLRSIDLSRELRADITDVQKRRLIRAHRRFLGDASFATPDGQVLAAGLSRRKGAFDMMIGPEMSALDRTFHRARLSMRLHGYTSAEVDAVLDGKTMSRPERWHRYYATSMSE